MSSTVAGNGPSLVNILLVLFVLSDGVSVTRAIDCYSCTDVRNTSDCHNVVVCHQQSCFVKSNGFGANQTFTLGCANGSICEVTTTTLSTTLQTTIKTTPSPSTTTTTTVVLPTHTNIPPTPTLVTSRAVVPSSGVASTQSSLLTTGSVSSKWTVDNPTTTVKTPLVGDPGPIGKRYVEYDDDSMYDETRGCNECCSSDGCNKHLCDPKHVITTTTPDPSVCRDTPDFGCDIAIKYFNICSDTEKAKNLCKKSCNLCTLVDGNWSEWGNWSSCDVTCGNGTRQRMRECDNPLPANGGDNCTESDLDTEFCREQECPTDGRWADWTPWSDCTVTCDIGLQKRTRNCSNPYPDADGLFCLGAAEDEKICTRSRCYVDEWLEWSSWSKCSHSCDFGLTSRTRSCNGTSLFGLSCTGGARESKLCKDRECPAGDWLEWTPWSECSATCDAGLKYRSRDCNNTDNSCFGDVHESVLCKERDCSDPVSAFLVNGVAQNGSENGSIIFSHVITNVGGDYNSSTGQFTCRIPGIYSFTVSIEKQPNVNQAFCQLMKNDNTTIYTGSRSAFIHDDTFQQASNSAVLVLETNDVVYLGRCSSRETFTTMSTFSGSLIATQ